MKQAALNTNDGLRPGEFSALPGFVPIQPAEWNPRPISHSEWPAPDAGKALVKACEALVSAYLDASLRSRSMPLKEFMDDLEKNILLACLRLTQGSQRNAAAILGLKPTALFEKMRKHRINGRRIKLSEKLMGARLREIA